MFGFWIFTCKQTVSNVIFFGSLPITGPFRIAKFHFDHGSLKRNHCLSLRFSGEGAEAGYNFYYQVEPIISLFSTQRTCRFRSECTIFPAIGMGNLTHVRVRALANKASSVDSADCGCELIGLGTLRLWHLRAIRNQT